MLGAERHGAACIAMARDGEKVVVAAGGHGGVDLFTAAGRKPLGGKRNVFALLFDGERLYEAGGAAGEKGEIRCWEWKSRKLIWEIERGEDIFHSLAISGGELFAGDADASVAILRAATGEALGELSGHTGAVLALAASPDGKLIASAGADRAIRLWERSSRKLLRSILNHAETVHALAWSPDGKRLASGSADRTVRIWQPEIGRLVRIVRDHEGAVLALAYAGDRVASGCADGKIRWIEAESAAIASILDGHRDWVVGLAAAPGLLASADWSGRILLWRGDKPEELAPAEESGPAPGKLEEEPDRALPAAGL